MTQEEKRAVLELIEQEKQKTKNAESVARCTIKRNLQKTRDSLYVVQHGLIDAISERKTSMTQMSNMLGWIEEAIANLKELGLWSEY